MKKTMANSLDQRKISSTIDKSGQDICIDTWLSERFKYRSKEEWQDFIKAEKILINNSPCNTSTTLKANDIVTFIPDIEEPEVDKNYQILFEDDYLLAVNKPGLLPCHPAGPYFKNTLWHLLSKQYENIHLINRIDRETSGLVLIAKDGKIAGQCVNSIKLKRYTVIVYGEFSDAFNAEGFLYGHPEISVKDTEKVRKKRYFSETQPENKNETAITIFKRISFNHKLSVLEADLKTGRMHQVRATLCSLGFPVVGDKIYGPDESIFIRFINDTMTDNDRKKLLISRQALHSTKMIFTHPVTEKEIEITAPIPEDMKSLM